MQPGTIAIPISHIQARAKERPAGYMDDILAVGTLNGDMLTMDRDEWERLKAKYRPNSPPLLKLLTNFASAISQWVAAGFPVVDSGEFERRLSLCQECELWDDTGLYAKCSKCGCTEIKLYLSTSHCVDGKW